MTLEDLARRYQVRYGQIRTATDRRMAVLWAKHGGLNDADAARFAELAAGQVQVALVATARMVAGYLTASRRLAGVDDEVTPLDLADVTTLRGVDALEEFHRPTVTARVAISEGKTFEEAMHLGGLRAGVLAVTDVALAQRAAVAGAGGGDRIVGYRRTLTGASCVLCQVASTQRYHRGTLAPLHSHCDCGIAEIYGDADPGRVINQDLLKDLKSRGEVDALTARQQLPKAKKALTNAHTKVDDLRKQIEAETDQERETRLERRLDRWKQEVTKRESRVAHLQQNREVKVAVREHGELGPVLTDASHEFTGPLDIAA